jgi:hypothetical protein
MSSGAERAASDVPLAQNGLAACELLDEVRLVRILDVERELGQRDVRPFS